MKYLLILFVLISCSNSNNNKREVTKTVVGDLDITTLEVSDNVYSMKCRSDNKYICTCSENPGTHYAVAVDCGFVRSFLKE